MIASVVIGIAAALIGGFIAQAMGVGNTGGIDWIKLVIQVIQVVLAAFGVSVFAGFAGTRARV